MDKIICKQCNKEFLNYKSNHRVFCSNKCEDKNRDNGITLAWGASFEAKGVALPTTTTLSKVMTLGFIWDSVTSKWGLVANGFNNNNSEQLCIFLGCVAVAQEE